ncbi:cell division protein FtsQ/DivIB [Seohaeicola zhoushanensis]|uniref:Cell division protein FtsQ n=1 Tax=Seohaeicola zhoushanensis TaxID=1569283 RepID=A0A8J3MBY4_9RHOB|nr:cell division protein FtsQ/DivIB [Seohaeicola zhoushanensis]GHF69401.1 cell division protein FtsQ [Seohaeicola zhoushanensis]
MRVARHDPAPSRFSYRVQRWMLTPGIRLALRAGVPFLLVFSMGSAYMAKEERRIALRDWVSDIRTGIEERPEFMVSLMAIDGAGTGLSEDIREVLPIDFPVSSFELNIEEIRQTVAGLDPVKSASVRIRPGGILQIDVIERQPAVIWRTAEGLSLLDETGIHIAEVASRADYRDLPLIAGEGADRKVAEALELIAAAAPLGARMRGLVRVGERRWDLVLDRDQRILLPTEQPVLALERVIALDQAQDMLGRDVRTVDMRLEERPTVKMSTEAVQAWWQTRALGVVRN